MSETEREMLERHEREDMSALERDLREWCRNLEPLGALLNGSLESELTDYTKLHRMLLRANEPVGLMAPRLLDQFGRPL